MAEFSRHTMGGGGGCTRWLNLVGTQLEGGGLHKVAEFSRHTKWGVGEAAQGG